MRRTWIPPRGRRGNSRGRNCSGRACGRRARGIARGGLVRPLLLAAPPPLGSRASARKSGMRRSSSAQSTSSPSAAGSSRAATVAAMRNMAGRRFSATSRYHESALWIAGSSQILILAKSLMCRHPSAAFVRRRDITHRDPKYDQSGEKRSEESTPSVAAVATTSSTVVLASGIPSRA